MIALPQEVNGTVDALSLFHLDLHFLVGLRQIFDVFLGQFEFLFQVTHHLELLSHPLILKLELLEMPLVLLHAL